MATPDQLTNLWRQTLQIVEKDLLKPSFDTWLKNTKPLALYESTILIAVPNDFARNWVEKKYAPQITKTLSLLAGKEMFIKFVIPPFPEAYFDMPPEPEPSNQLPPPKPQQNTLAHQLNPRYTFDSFVVGSSNRFAHAAALAVAETPAKAYNPLFIYGGVGLGKTHLMHAIGHLALSRSQHLRVLYVSSETFTNELINAIRDGNTLSFKNRYRNIDILLIDDIQFLAGKEASQEEFFHTFDALHQANKQLVISSDRPPKDIATLEERLRTRFEWGLITDIQPPDLETRVAILRKKANFEQFDLPNDVLLYIATEIDSNIRELEGALIRIMAFASLNKRPVTLELASEVLKDIIPASRPKQITASAIQEAVANYFGIKIEDFKVKKRNRAVAYPRQIAMYLTRELTDYSLPKIGEEFGGRDHTTVMHACEKIANDLLTDKTLEATIRDLKERLKA